ncbi:VOC family protein [Streptomyces sp. NPDC051963]|uniref:VOC family protein n=1 Tax=Streptomyces sp. NPDC051963 TaxID=3365678 RepID=UPI0037D472A2
MPISLPPVFHVGIIVEKVGFSARYGFIRTGSSEIELIQPLDGRSPYTEFLDLHGEGVQHLAYVVGSIDQYLEALRATGEAGRVTFEATIAGQTRFVYLDGLAHGPAIELIEATGEDA